MYNPNSKIFNRYQHTQNHSYDIPHLDRNLAKYHDTSNRDSHVDQETLQFRPNQHQESIESDDSGVCSPPLWKTNSPSPPKSPSYPLLANRNLSPNSRAKAIAKGQWELMEMVKNMPESSYELSLKDIVEHHNIESSQVPQSLQQRGVVKLKKQESKKNEKNMMRSGSFETKGLFLNMVFPFSMKSKKRKNFVSNSTGKVSPKPSDGLKGEKDWWKKKFTGSSDSDSSRTTNNSGTSDTTRSSSGGSSDQSNRGGRKKNEFLTGCWPFFNQAKAKP